MILSWRGWRSPGSGFQASSGSRYFATSVRSPDSLNLGWVSAGYGTLWRSLEFSFPRGSPFAISPGPSRLGLRLLIGLQVLWNPQRMYQCTWSMTWAEWVFGKCSVTSGWWLLVISVWYVSSADFLIEIYSWGSYPLRFDLRCSSISLNLLENASFQDLFARAVRAWRNSNRSVCANPLSARHSQRTYFGLKF